tara:strand:+ start:47 stop:985 length:939 start_codon:yes stop_codon:yes gene_type:complete
MRNSFANTVIELADSFPELVLLAGDIGNRLFDKFKEQYPNRFYNCGVAEAGMTGIAAGLAASGLRPITYTITPFNTARCLEQIRLDVCYPNLPVIFVGTGSGLSYANLGTTHHSMEDIGFLRLLPNMNVVCPADSVEVELALEDAFRLSAPTYIRLGKKGEPLVHTKKPGFQIGKGLSMREGKDVVLLSIGNMLPVALECADSLEEQNVSAKVISFHTVKPLDTELLRNLFSYYPVLCVLEEHGVAGGCGSAILEWGNQNRIDLRKLYCFGGPDRFLTACGNQEEARQEIGLTTENIIEKITLLLKNHDSWT